MVMLALVTGEVSTYETSVNFSETTRCNIPEYFHLHTHRLEYPQFSNDIISSFVFHYKMCVTIWEEP
jgi:hypothetical protein